MSAFCSNVGDLGSGSGKGGGSGGPIRDAGGAFGKQQAAKEEQYFYNLEKERLKALRLQSKNLRKEMEREIEEHEEQVKIHRDSIDRLKRRINELKEDEKGLNTQ